MPWLAPIGTPEASGDAHDGNLIAVSAPEIPEIPGDPAAADGAGSSAVAPAEENGAAARQASDAVRRMIAVAHTTATSARTLNRLAVLLAARAPETVLKLDDLDDGDLKHHTDFRRVYASLLDDWLGVPAAPVVGEGFAPLDLFAKRA